MKSIRKIEVKKQTLVPLKKVAAYARVSVQSERMQHSLSAQVSYYNKLIGSKKEWSFAGIYSDYGISGTQIKKRDGFKKMLEDCNAGKIDIILTKSIQRFARNTVELLATVRDLKSKGIEVRFEKENISSITADGELMLSILASFAQEESRSISENVRWGTIKRYKQGIPNGRFSVYGYTWVGDKLVPVKEEAKIVKLIFNDYLNGSSRAEIARKINKMNMKTRYNCEFNEANTCIILRNSIYTGDLLLQKEYVDDPINHKRIINKGERPQYLVENHHEAIIDKETFEKAQKEYEKRNKLGFKANKSLVGILRPFSGKIVCGNCGIHYRHSAKRNGKEKILFHSWVCRNYNKFGKKVCDSKMIPEEAIKKCAIEVLGLKKFDEKVFEKKIDYIKVLGTALEFYFYDGTIKKNKIDYNARKESWTNERRLEKGKYMKSRWEEIKKCKKSQ